MKIGFVGLGKAGLPIALAFEKRGHEVFGTDRNANRRTEVWYREDERDENGDLLWYYLREQSKLEFVEFAETAERADFCFVLVGTPSAYTSLGEDSELTSAYDMSKIDEVLAQFTEINFQKPVVIASTCYPSYLCEKRRQVAFPIVHVPQFCAMGTAVRDTLDPEFVIIGHELDDVKAALLVERFYRTIAPDAPVVHCGLTEAELIKTTYNGTVMWKLNYVNTLAMLCEELGGADVDVVTSALALSTRRIFAPTYWRAGGGDGGPCHPKEVGMLAELAGNLDIISNPWLDNMANRYEHAHWVARKVREVHNPGSPLYLIGKGFKRDNPVPDHGWPLLMAHILAKLSPKFYDPLCSEEPALARGTYLICMDHSFVQKLRFPKGSVVIDPWGIVQPQPHVSVQHLGRVR